MAKTTLLFLDSRERECLARIQGEIHGKSDTFVSGNR